MKIRDSICLFFYEYGEIVSSIALAACVFLMLVFSCLGCATTCPPPEVVTVPQIVEVPVPTIGTELPLCVPSHEVCNQPDVTDRVQCAGRNVADLRRCNDLNASTIEAHNEGVTDAPPG